MLSIILSRVGDGKSTFVINKIGELLKQGKRSFLIVPDQMTYAAERNICSRLDIEGFSLCSVMSFNRFCTRVAESSGEKCPTRLSDSGRLMMLDNAIDNCRGELGIYRTSCKRSGFAQRMERMLALLKSCRVTPEGLESMMNSMPEGLLRLKLSDTARIYRAYQNMLNKDYCDNNDLFALAVEKSGSGMLDGAHIFIDGFESLTAQMIWFIGKLLERCDITVTLSLDPEAPRLYSAQQQTYDALIAEASKKMGSVRTVELEKRVRGNAFDLLHLMYNEKDQSMQEPKEAYGIDLFEAEDTEQEIRHVAYSIRQKLRDGARMRDFAVVCADASLISSVERIFDQYGIKVFCDTARPMLAQPAVQLVMGALNACTDDMASTVDEVIASYLCPIEHENAEILRKQIKRLGLTNREVIKGSTRISKETAELLAPLAPLTALYDGLEKCNCASDFARCVWDFINGIDLAGRLDGLIRECVENGLNAEADEYKQVWDNMMLQLEQINMLLGNAQQEKAHTESVEGYISMLTRGFESQSCFVLPSTVDCITVGDISRSRFDSVKELYVIGAAEGYFPPVQGDEGLLSPFELQYINKDKKVLTPDTEDSSVRDIFRIFSMLLTPRELHLSYAHKKGRATQQKGRMLTKMQEYCVIPVINADTDAEMAASLRGATELIASRQGNYEVYHASVLEAVKRFGGFRGFEFASDTPSDASALYKDKTVSVSKLETQAECPLKNLLTGGLALNEDKEFQTDAIDVGNVMHDTLERSVPELIRVMQTHGEVSQEQVFGVVDKNLYAAASESHDGVMLHTARARLILKRLTKTVGSACGGIINDTDSFVPERYEACFGSNGLPAIELETPRGTVRLRGIIDRVDISKSRDAIRIVDYKSSLHKIDLQSVEQGKTLQLPLYIMAMQQQMQAKGVAMYYQNCFSDKATDYYGIYSDHPLNKGKAPITQNQFDELLERAAETSARLACDMLAGKADICPPAEREGNLSSCNYCPHQKVCIKHISKHNGADN